MNMMCLHTSMRSESPRLVEKAQPCSEIGNAIDAAQDPPSGIADFVAVSRLTHQRADRLAASARREIVLLD
jgi:hypothetical protein